MRNITMIVTASSGWIDGVMTRPACELYRTMEQAQRNVLRREYERGIMTFLRTTKMRAYHVFSTVNPVGDVF